MPAQVCPFDIFGGLSLRRSDPDHMPLLVANRILGGTSLARLYSNLSEEKGYTYDAFSRVSEDLFLGVFVANTEVRNNVTEPSLHELMCEFERLRDEKVPQAELEKAKGSIISSFALSLEPPSRIAESWMAVKYYGLPADYDDNYSDRIAKADAVQRVERLPVHPVHKMRKLVLLGGQGGKGRKGGKQRIHCVHAYLRLCSLRIRDLQKCG
jgi:predicted Zn-dependent peptidase